MIQFKPDWWKVMTAAEAESQFEGFKFNGPGWYHADGTTMLVIPCDRPMNELWYQRHNAAEQPYPANEKFEFNVFDGHNPSDTFNSIVNAPTRL